MPSGPKTRPKPNNTPLPGVPIAPRYLDKVAKEHWKEVTALLHEAGTLSMVDVDCLTLYTSLWSRWREAETHLQEEGCTIEGAHGECKSPWLAVSSQALTQLRVYQSHLGLTPKSRQGNPLPPKKEDSKWTL